VTVIYMIEDNPLDVELMTMSLKESGLACTVQVADDGERGVQLLQQAGRTVPLPALILLDLNIPRISGLEVLAMGRANPALRDLPIVILSGSLNPRDAEAAMTGGASAFLLKPQSVDGYFAIAEKLLGLMRVRST
jgi:two-component system response regulator